MSQTKVQLIAPIGVVTASTLETTGVLTATTFVGDIEGTVTGITSTTDNLNLGIVTATSFAGDFTGIGSGLTGTPNIVAGIVTATKFIGNTPGTVSGVADGTNINAGIITATSFVGNLTGNAAGLSTTTANLNLGIVTATSFAGNFTGVASGITGTPNIVVGIMTGTLNGDGSSLTGIAATNWITNNVTANSSTTTVDLSLGNVVKFTQSADTTVSFANTGTSNLVSFIRTKDENSTERTITWPSSIKWDGGSAPTLISNFHSGDINVITLITRDEGVTWYGWESVNVDPAATKLYMWGNNTGGQLGLNNTTQYSSPTQLPGHNWNRVVGNWETYVATKTDGTLWSWGENEHGMLGDNSTVNKSSPTQIPGTTWTIDNIRKFTSGANGPKNAAAIKTDGTLWSWGYNSHGQLGLNNNTQYSSPVQIGTDTDWDTINMGQTGSAAAVKTDGTLWMWGHNGWGNLGQNNRTNMSSPVQVPGTNWDYVMSSNGSWYNTMGRKTDGTLWSWGYSHYGGGMYNLGGATYRSSPIQIPGTSWTTEFSQGGEVTGAIRTNGTLWVWGLATDGQLAQPGNKINRSSPVQIPSAVSWSKIHVNRYYLRGLKSDGTLWGWGRNTSGELGLNNRTSYSSPVQIPGTWLEGTLSGTITGIGMKEDA